MNAAFPKQCLRISRVLRMSSFNSILHLAIFSPTTMTSDITVPKGLKKAKIQILLIFIYRAHSPHVISFSLPSLQDSTNAHLKHFQVN